MLVKVSQDLATSVLPPGLLMVHDSIAGRQHHDTRIVYLATSC